MFWFAQEVSPLFSSFLSFASLVGAAASLLLISNGDIMGFSGILLCLFNPVRSATQPTEYWKLVYLGSFVLTVALAVTFLKDVGHDQRLESSRVVPVASTLAHVLGGFFVGLGTRLGNGCTTGHGICGLSRFSKRSMVSVLTFMATSMATAAALASPQTPWAQSTSFLRTDALPQVSPTLATLVRAAGLGLLVLSQTPTANDGSIRHHHLRKSLGAAASGAIFAVGLTFSGMTKKSKVHDFLDVCSFCRGQGTFDPTLISVLCSAIFTSWLGYRYVGRRRRNTAGECQPLCGSSWSIPTGTEIDAPLVLGAGLFGIGWGLTGLCPGPAMYAAAVGVVDVVWAWFPAFLIGSYAGIQLKNGVWKDCGKAKTL